jgi:hypothetical protein
VRVERGLDSRVGDDSGWQAIELITLPVLPDSSPFIYTETFQVTPAALTKYEYPLAVLDDRHGGLNAPIQLAQSDW